MDWLDVDLTDLYLRALIRIADDHEAGCSKIAAFLHFSSGGGPFSRHR